MAVLNIVVGKYYRTRSGRKAYVSGEMQHNPLLKRQMWWKFVGAIEGNNQPTYWTETGHVTTVGNYECPNDLVEEWREPVSKTVFVYLYRHRDHAPDVTYHSVTELPWAKPPLNTEILACKTIRITEGEGITQSSA